MKDHIFNRDASFIIIEQICKSTLSRKTKKNLLKRWENFWILKLETFKPKGLNQELNKEVKRMHFNRTQPSCFFNVF